MRFRANVFGALFWLTALGMGGMICASLAGASQGAVEAKNSPYLDSQTNDAIKLLSLAICGSLTVQYVCGLGTPFLLFFGLLSWRNSAGARAERHHQERMQIESERNAIMWQSAFGKPAFPDPPSQSKDKRKGNRSIYDD